ncbi:MAG: DUF1622 domain-containing protein [Deinococcota bacterium]
MDILVLINHIGEWVDLFGVLVLIIGLVGTSIRFIQRIFRETPDRAYEHYRQRVGHVILLGLEILIIADIIRTVAVTPTITNMLVLLLIVIIRTFLSFMLHVELEGHFPWQPPQHTDT